MAYEVTEWANDPYVNNATPAWGGVGQTVGSCQGNFEVGDPLTGRVAHESWARRSFSFLKTHRGDEETLDRVFNVLR